MNDFPHEEEALGKVYDSRLMKRLLRYLAPYKLTVAAAFVLVILASPLKLVGPFLTKVAIDDYIANGEGTGRDSGIKQCIPSRGNGLPEDPVQGP